MDKIKRLAVVALVVILVGTCVTSVSALSAESAAEFATFKQISRGSSHSGYIKALQRFLYCYPSTRTTIASSGGVDGAFGASTALAVKTFQNHQWPNDESKWDGIVGSETWRRIGLALTYDPASGEHYDLTYDNKQVLYVDTRAEGERFYNYNQTSSGTVYVDTLFHEA